MQTGQPSHGCPVKGKKRKDMNWLEIIEIRSAGGSRRLIESQLKNLIGETAKETRQPSIRVYNLATVDTDFSIHLLHDSDKLEKGGSPLGLHLASALKEFGLVSHSIWIDIHDRT